MKAIILTTQKLPRVIDNLRELGRSPAFLLCSDDIIRSLEQNGGLLHKFGHFVLMISLDLMKSLEVRKVGD